MVAVYWMQADRIRIRKGAGECDDALALNVPEG
jgi:hypothetical protein